MQLRFENIGMLWGLLPVLVLGLYVLSGRKKKLFAFSWPRFLALHLSLVCCFVGLSRPQGGTHVTSSAGRTSNIFIALDISRSMLVQDTLPTRIQFSTTFVQRLLPRLSGARFALFPFTLDGYVQVPLTSDVLAVSDLLSALSPNIITLQGTDLTHSLDTLLTRIQEAEERAKSRGGDWAGAEVILLSDGESHEKIDTSVLENFRRAHIPVFTVLAGTPAGGPVPWDPRTSNFREPSSKTAFSKADPTTLKKISELTGGRAFPGTFDSLDSLTEHLQRAMQMGKLTTQFRVEREFFPYCFLLALFLLALYFLQERWQYAIRSWLFFVLFLPTLSYGNNNLKEAIQKYNQGLQAIQNGDLKNALELFQESAYLSDNKEVQKKSLYSLGNTYLKSGDATQALQAYQQAYDTLTGNSDFDQEANQRISDNMVLAAKIEQQQKEEAQKKQQGQGSSEGEQKGNSEDPKGPRQFQAQQMDEGMKKKVYDAVTNEERQGLQRTMENRNRGSSQVSSKPW